jgi:exonuclease III
LALYINPRECILSENLNSRLFLKKKLGSDHCPILIELST